MSLVIMLVVWVVVVVVEMFVMEEEGGGVLHAQFTELTLRKKAWSNMTNEEMVVLLFLSFS